MVLLAIEGLLQLLFLMLFPAHRASHGLATNLRHLSNILRREYKTADFAFSGFVEYGVIQFTAPAWRTIPVLIMFPRNYPIQPSCLSGMRYPLFKRLLRNFPHQWRNFLLLLLLFYLTYPAGYKTRKDYWSCCLIGKLYSRVYKSQARQR